jgi:hypothetical protein
LLLQSASSLWTKPKSLERLIERFMGYYFSEEKNLPFFKPFFQEEIFKGRWHKYRDARKNEEELKKTVFI